MEFIKSLQTQNKIPILIKYPLAPTLVFESSLAFLALLFSYQMDIFIINNLYWNSQHFIFSIGMSGVLFIISLGMYHAPFHFVTKIRVALSHRLDSIFKDISLLKISLVSLAAGLGEEFFFRGFLQEYFYNSIGTWPALLVSNFLFGLAHWKIAPLYSLFAGFLGVLLGLSMIYTDNLLVPVIIHTLYDFIALYYFSKRR